MKRIVLLVVSLVLVSTNVFADGLTATLQQGDKMTPFYGVDAFKQAYAAADSGAVITLSAGTFNNVDTIAKSIKIIGNYAFDASSPENTILTRAIIAANKVTIDGIYFSGSVTLGNIEDCKIVHSWINSLAYSSTSAWHTNTIVDQCVIKAETAIKQGRNYTIKNSTINKFGANNTSDNIAYIANCVIYDFVYSHTSPTSNDAGIAFAPSIPVAIYKNNVLGIDVSCFYYSPSASSSKIYKYYNVYFSSPSEFYYNIYAMTYYNNMADYSDYYTYDGSNVYYISGCQNAGNTKKTRSSVVSGTKYPAVLTNPGYGQDGTLRGPQGGTGFSSYPSIPRVTSKMIDSNTDADGKLNVKITVKAQ